MLCARLLACALSVAVAPAAVGQDRDVLRKPLVGKAAPPWLAHDADWLAGPPTPLAAFKGKVVWLEFNF